MPLDEMGGCLTAVLRCIGGLLDLVGGVTDLAQGLGQLGRWPFRIITFGRVDLDPERWPAILLGFILLVMLLTLIGLWETGLRGAQPARG